MTTSYSPQVVKCVSSASELATKLRKVMTRIESCKSNHMPIPVKLSRRAEVLLSRVEEWRYGSSNIDEGTVTCPLRFTKLSEEESTSPTGSRASSSGLSLSPPKQTSNSSPYKKKQSMMSFDSVLRNKYQRTWRKTKENQEKLISSLKR